MQSSVLCCGKCKSGKQRETCSSALCAMDDASYFLVIRRGPKTSECEKNVTVVSTVTGCDVTSCATTLLGFNKPRLPASRGCVRFARRPSLHREQFHKIYACSHVSIIRLVHFHHTFCLQLVFHHSFPSCQLPRELVSLSCVSIPSIDLNL